MADTTEATKIREYASSITTVRCSGCHLNGTISKDELLLRSGTFLAGNDSVIEFNFNCTVCSAVTCVGCGEQITEDTEKVVKSTETTHLVWHCDRARLALIWLVLCCFEKQAEENETAMKVVRDGSRSSSSSHGLKRADNGVGYGYDGGDHPFLDPEDEYLDDYPVYAMARSYERQNSKTPTNVNVNDSLTAKVLEALTALFPSTAQPKPTNFDLNPPELLVLFMLNGSILYRTADLLRNNSLADATRRAEVYASLFNFMRAVSSSSNGVNSIPYRSGICSHNDSNLLNTSYISASHQNAINDKSAPLACCMVDLHSQSAMMLKSAQASPQEFESEESQSMLRLCNQVVECSKLLKANGAHLLTMDGWNMDTNTKEDPLPWQENIRVTEVLDDDIVNRHAYAQIAKNLMSSPTGRMRLILSELATLKTALPPNIFVRYGESRVDIMKFLIVGPKGTPYENGLFEFDLFCPPDYPNRPPSVWFKTTGGGCVGLNPNLYNTGKVCLSLLGTWDGETWEPGKSTLLQVLVSIQAMVFCADPYCNEPGCELYAGSEKSKEYNRLLYSSVVRYGMLEWIDGKKTIGPGPRPDRYIKPVYEEALGLSPLEHAQSEVGADVWKDVTEMHFKTNAEEIKNTVREWVKDRANRPPDHRRPRKKQKTSDPSEPTTGTKVAEMGSDVSLGDFLARAVEEMQSEMDFDPRHPFAALGPL